MGNSNNKEKRCRKCKKRLIDENFLLCLRCWAKGEERLEKVGIGTIIAVGAYVVGKIIGDGVNNSTNEDSDD